MSRMLGATFCLLSFLAFIGFCSAQHKPGTANGVSVPEREPGLTFQTLDGQSESLAHYRGKVVLLNFWGTWCELCRSEIPDLIALQRIYGSRGFTVLGVAMQDTTAKVALYAAKPQFDVGGQKVAMNYPVVLGGDDVAAKFGGFAGYPDSLFISKDGVVEQKVLGPIDARSASQLIRRLLRREEETVPVR